ncbi:branched-chain amino acid transport system permease protein [Streptosporangium album]|uniref:Branched-chain amino acid transport system permease protein n=1 Tax=Streptosporangium album TaxID=47479 RepID=A0A7W7WDT8_9ACTN|nr:branched-chain amino acid ABC transporter permease [Streptosporangium album]MBB4942705.1 branched-chain amino acid transport system permease protein [Streptosporangium album]
MQPLLFGLLVGGVYALASSGLTLIFGVMRIVNLTHGAVLIAGAFLTYTICTATGIDPFATIPVVGAVLAGLGWLIHKLVVQRAEHGGEGTVILSTLAFAMVLEGVTILIWGHEPHTVATSYARASFRLGDLVFPTAQVYGSAVALALLAALYMVLNHTWLGRAVRAATANPQGAELVGIRVERVNLAAFALGIALTGAAGSILAVLSPFTPDSGEQWIGLGLAIVVLGGMGSLGGALLGALILGVAETFTATYGSPAWATAMPFAVIVLVLLLRPQGIFGVRVRQDVVTA